MLTMPCHRSENGSPATTIEDLQKRCQILLNDLEQFQTHLKSTRRETSVELRTFDGNIKADLKALQKLDLNHERIAHLLRSTNVPFFEAVWEAARRSKGVIAFVKRFYWEDKGRVSRSATRPEAEGSRSDIKTPTSKYKDSALVDIVADNGATWIKVSTVTQNRLIWQLARQGWNPDDDESESDDDDQDVTLDNEEVSILRMAQELNKASLETRVHFKHPRIHLILPKLSLPLLPPVQYLIKRINRLYPSITVSLGDSSFLATPAPTLNTALGQGLVVDSIASLTPTLNIDCTILLALVSDLSHARDCITREDWFHRATLRQIEMEKEEALLPQTLYPALEGRNLLCTAEAAKRMNEIVATIATESEKKRTKLLLGTDFPDNNAEGVTANSDENLLAKWAELSDYLLPKDFRLPIRIISADSSSSYPSATDTGVAAAVSGSLSALNKSVFLYGWRSGVCTMTSNRTVVKEVDIVISTELDTIARNKAAGKNEQFENEFVGPQIWLCGTSRSLIGKEKGRH